MDIYTIIGLGGVAAYVAAYALLQLGFLDGNGVTYSVMNVAAAALVLVSLMKDFNLASAVTQVTWIFIGLVGLALRFARGRTSVSTLPTVQQIEADREAKLHLVPDQPVVQAHDRPLGRATLELRPDVAPLG